MNSVARLASTLKVRKPTKEELLRALAKIYPQATPEQKHLIRNIVLALAPPPPAVDPELLLPFVEDDDWRNTVRNAPAEWCKFVVAQVLRSRFGLTQRDLPSVFAALGELGTPLQSAVRRQLRIDANPAGTGKNPEYEREVAESQLLPEDAPSPLDLAPSTEPDPAELIAEADWIARAFGQLKPEEQTLLRLVAEGYTDAEIAQMLNLPRETVKKRRQRAVQRVKRLLSA